jgi:hypothetical protein
MYKDYAHRWAKDSAQENPCNTGNRPVQKFPLAPGVCFVVSIDVVFGKITFI